LRPRCNCHAPPPWRVEAGPGPTHRNSPNPSAGTAPLLLLLPARGVRAAYLTVTASLIILGTLAWPPPAAAAAFVRNVAMALYTRVRALACCLHVLALVLALALAGCVGDRTPEEHVARLGHPKAKVRNPAIDALGRLQEKALPYIEPELGNENPEARKSCLAVLGKVRRMESLTIAARLLDDPDEGVRIKAVDTLYALAGVWKDRASELLAEALDDSHTEVVRKAAEGLKNMDYAAATTALRRKVQAGQGFQAVYAARYLYERDPSDDVAQFLLARLSSPDDQVRSTAEWAFGELNSRIVRPLVAAVDAEPSANELHAQLGVVRDKLIDELARTLDRNRARDIIAALAVVADGPSIAKLTEDMNDRRLESTWRMNAAHGLGDAGLSPRVSAGDRVQAIRALSEVLPAPSERGPAEPRIPIAASIALCRLRQRNGVGYLLDVLSDFEQMIAKEPDMAESKRHSLTELRVRAQEALTASGEYVVPVLQQQVHTAGAGPTIIWAAAKTFGELAVVDAVPFLGQALTQQRGEVPDAVTVARDGSLSQGFQLSDPANPTDEEVAVLMARLEEFAQPDYVRWTAATALGQIGGTEAVTFLDQAEAAEQDFLARLEANRQQKLFHARQPVITGLIRRHRDILFYVRLALEDARA
jgi:HEAT repeat protein